MKLIIYTQSFSGVFFLIFFIKIFELSYIFVNIYKIEDFIVCFKHLYNLSFIILCKIHYTFFYLSNAYFYCQLDSEEFKLKKCSIWALSTFFLILSIFGATTFRLPLPFKVKLVWNDNL